MAIFGNFETTVIQKQSIVILVNYKENYDSTMITTANKSMGFVQLGPGLKSETKALDQSSTLNSLWTTTTTYRKLFEGF